MSFRQALALVLLCLPAAAAFPAAEQPGPVDTVDGFHKTLIQALQAPSFEQRVEILTPAVDRRFNLQTIARISLGRHWRSLSADQQTRVIEALRMLVITTYADRFDRWNNQQFTTLGTRDMPRDRVRVNTQLATDDETVSLDYQLQLTGGEWRIYDIVAEGVSDLALKRSSYAALFDAGGLEAVIAEIEQSTAGNGP